VKAQPTRKSNSCLASTERDSSLLGATSLVIASLISLSVIALNLARKIV